MRVEENFSPEVHSYADDSFVNFELHTTEQSTEYVKLEIVYSVSFLAAFTFFEELSPSRRNL